MSISTGNGLKYSDLYTVIYEVSKNVVGKQIALDFIEDQWERVKNM